MNHVLYNHIRTPLFVAALLGDSNQYDNAIEHLGEGQATVSWKDLGAPDEYVERSRFQLLSFLRDRDDPSGGADGEAHGAAVPSVWAPQAREHVLAHDRCKFAGITVGGHTLADALVTWLGRERVILVDGYDGATTEDCPTSR